MKNKTYKRNHIILFEIICVMITFILFVIKIIIFKNIPITYIGYNNICKIHNLVIINYLSNWFCSLAVFVCIFVPFGFKLLILLKNEFKYSSSFSIIRLFKILAFLIINTIISIYMAMTLYYSSYGNYFTERGNCPKDDKKIYSAISRDIANDNISNMDVDLECNSMSVDVRNLRDTFSSRHVIRSSMTRTIYKLNIVLENSSYSFIIGINDYANISNILNDNQYSSAKIEYYVESGLIKNIQFF